MECEPKQVSVYVLRK